MFNKELTRKEVEQLIEKHDSKKLEFPPLVQEYRLDPESSQILHAIVREYKPTSVIEFGTSWGGSGRVIVRALLENKQPFKYTGFEIDLNMKKTAYDNISQLAPDSVEVYGDVTQNADKLPDEIDFAFIDPDQDINITRWWLKNILPRIKKGGLVQIHDWSVRTREEDGKLVYEGGNFEGIHFLINMVESNMLPLRKIYAVWDYEDYRAKQIAASFWIKE